MFHFRFSHRHGLCSISLLVIVLAAGALSVVAQTPRTPSEVVREFYQAMLEHRFPHAWPFTHYKLAVEGLTAEEMEDLRADFEDKASQIPEKVEIAGEQISGNNATVLVKAPATDGAPQSTPEPVTLINSGGMWIIGDEANQEIVKKAGRRFFLDALISQHQSDMMDLLKRVLAVQLVYGQQHAGAFGDLQALITAGLIPKEAGDPKSI